MYQNFIVDIIIVNRIQVQHLLIKYSSFCTTFLEMICMASNSIEHFRNISFGHLNIVHFYTTFIDIYLYYLFVRQSLIVLQHKLIQYLIITTISNIVSSKKRAFCLIY